jgi:multidrug efflux pump subunit AcrA (membrane-fusion protein)
MIIEQIESEIPREILAPRLDLVYEHSARALSNSIDHNSLFLMPVWRTIGKSRWVVQSRTLPKTVSIVTAAVVLLVASLVIPANFDMKAKGTLLPVQKQDVFAPLSGGEIFQVLHDNGEMVQAGAPLLILRNSQLEIKKGEIEGQFKAAQQSLFAVVQQLTSPSDKMSEVDRVRLDAEEAMLRPQIDSLEKQLEEINKQVEALTVRSPLSGRIITWDAKKQLQNRPVEAGQVLLTVAAADTDYEVELLMPERRIGHLHRARDRAKANDPAADLTVHFITMIDPGVSHSGHILHVNPTAEPHEEHGNVVRIRVQPDSQLTNPRPGATVTANVHCGRAPWLWSKLHEAWEWLEASPVLF